MKDNDPPPQEPIGPFHLDASTQQWEGHQEPKLCPTKWYPGAPFLTTIHTRPLGLLFPYFLFSSFFFSQPTTGFTSLVNCFYLNLK